MIEWPSDGGGGSTQQGELIGIPPLRIIGEVSGIEFLRVVRGQIVEDWIGSVCVAAVPPTLPEQRGGRSAGKDHRRSPGVSGRTPFQSGVR